ncbi:MAG TPA: lactonase family protein [Capsulimonadaceae bacterium]|nr:lactonase family protein [Capsulimonadaceae bacterium]
MQSLVFVGTYSRRSSEGIYVFRVDPDTGALTKIASAPSENPSHLALSSNGRFLYAVNELGEYQGQPGGAASAFAVDKDTGKLTFLNQQAVLGSAPCHALVDPTGKWFVTANYAGGSHSILPIQADGQLGPVRTLILNADKTAARAHSTLFSPDGRYFYTCDLGLNQVAVYALALETGAASKVAHVELPERSGPRHQALHPTHPLVYVLNEHGSTVSVLSRDATEGGLTLLQNLPTLPTDFAEHNACADLHLSPDGRFLYGSNRGHNSLAVFAIGDDGLLTAIGHVSTGGDSPRGFGVLANGLILVANERSDNVVAFRIGPDGIPVPTGAVTSVPCPTCIISSAQ